MSATPFPLFCYGPAPFSLSLKLEILFWLGCKIFRHTIPGVSKFYSLREQFWHSFGYNLSLGIKSAIGSTYNYCGKVNCSIVEAYKKNDMDQARKLQVEAHKYLKIFMKYGGNPAVVTRAFLIMLGVDVGPPRLPNMPLNNEELNSLKTDLQNAGFFDNK